MSYMALYRIKTDGTFEDQKEFRNAHGWCSFIWGALVRKYGLVEARERTGWKDPDPMCFGPFADWGYLWHLHAQGEIKLRPWEHNVLVSTYDRHIVKANDFDLYARSLEMFHEAHHRANIVDHTKGVADEVWLMNAEGTREKTMGLCFYPMSVSDDYWYRYDSETDESIPYDFSKGTDHKVCEMEPWASSFVL